MTVEVLPLDARPDMAMIRDYYEARPYEAPDTCPISPWVGPDVRGNSNYAHYWLETDGLSAEVPGLFVANEQQSMGVFGDGVIEALTVSARHLERGMDDVVALTTIWNSNARLASFVFPEPGCWELEITSSRATATFVLYVYPAECEPELRDGRFVASCEPPRE